MTTNRDRLTDDYDLRAYEAIVKTITRKPTRAKAAIDKVADSAADFGRKAVEHVPQAAAQAIQGAMVKVSEGFRDLIVEPSFRSVMVSRVQKRYERLGHPVEELEDIADLRLRDIDKAMPPLGTNYAITMALEGAIAGGVVTGAEALGAVGSVASAGVAAGPSAGAVAAAIAVDAAAVLGASLRVVAHVGSYFGRDLKLPEEQVFAMSIINWSGAGTDGAKTVAFQQLSRVTQQLIRGVTWKQLNEHAIIVAIDKAMLSLGFDMTKRKMGQAVPILGIAIGAGLNAKILQTAARDARTAYRLRHLVEMYDLDPTEFGAVRSGPDDDLEAVLGELEKGTEE